MVEFVQDQSEKFTFTSFPILFDEYNLRNFCITYSNSNSYRFENVISFADLFKQENYLIKNNKLSFTIHILPGDTNLLSDVTRFFFAVRRK
jgi:hypothetical protein